MGRKEDKGAVKGTEKVDKNIMRLQHTTLFKYIVMDMIMKTLRYIQL